MIRRFLACGVGLVLAFACSNENVLPDDPKASAAGRGGRATESDAAGLFPEGAAGSGAASGWYCATDDYADGLVCDCNCGATDPDCADPNHAVAGCGVGQRCAERGVCIPADWTCAADDFGDGSVCHCECGAPDPDCDTPGASVEGCTAGERCGRGRCVPEAWTCDQARYSDGTSCECTCGAVDPDCDDPALGTSDCGGAPYVCKAPGDCTYGAPSRSCALGADCGGVSCCTAATIPGSTYGMGRGPTEDYPFALASETPERQVTVTEFDLDVFEVTVGRFRRFADFFDGTAPPEGAGAHPRVPGSGWQAAWDAELPEGDYIPHFCGALYAQPALNDQVPICVSWYLAFAFCIWDGGRLPTEAEWELAAAGGDEQRLFPWGDEVDLGVEVAGIGAFLPASSLVRSGRWGHAGLGISVTEWTLDAFAVDAYATHPTCSDCAHLDPTATERVVRGGAGSLLTYYRSAFRSGQSPQNPSGFRCAYDR